MDNEKVKFNISSDGNIDYEGDPSYLPTVYQIAKLSKRKNQFELMSVFLIPTIFIAVLFCWLLGSPKSTLIEQPKVETSQGAQK